MTSPKKDTTVFLKIPLFRDLPKLELYQLVNELPIETFEEGQYVFHEGEPGNSLYVVVKGELQIMLAAGTEDEMFLRTCGPGE